MLTTYLKFVFLLKFLICIFHIENNFWKKIQFVIWEYIADQVFTFKIFSFFIQHSSQEIQRLDVRCAIAPEDISPVVSLNSYCQPLRYKMSSFPLSADITKLEQLHWVENINCEVFHSFRSYKFY